MCCTLENAKIADLEKIYELEISGFEPGIFEAKAVFHERITAFPEGFFLLKYNQIPIGYSCCEIWQDYTPKRIDQFNLGHDIKRYLSLKGSTLYLASMTVNRNFRGQNYGSFLFNQTIKTMIDHFQTLKNAVLIVNQNWTGAVAIYKKAGFQKTGEIPDFFHPQNKQAEKALIMEKGFKT